MMSRIEQLISEIEEYIDSCKFQALSNSKIIVNKEELEELLVELRLRIPDEIKKYQKIISQQDTILGEAQAQAIVDAAVNDANNIRQSSIQYTDDMLRSLQTIINHTMEGAKGRFDAFMTSMQSSYDIVSSNRNELSGGIVRQEEQEMQQEPDQEQM